MESLQVSIEEARANLQSGGIAVADMILRQLIAMNPGHTEAMRLLAGLARSVGETWWAEQFERRIAGGAAVPATEVPAAASEGPTGYLLIKAWGNGFCSDLDHTLGHLLLAEMTGRIPVVHWGRNSLFGADPDQDAFSLFFEPVSALTIDDLIGREHDYFPPKWNDANLRQENLNRISGDWSSLPPIAYFNRPERVVVADYYAGVSNLLPWIRPGHPVHRRHVADIYRYLIARYLRPRADIQREIDEFAAAHMSRGPVIGAHVRGSDKYKEDPDLEKKYSAYPQAISQLSAGMWFPSIFLMTDSTAARDDFARRYGDGLITTDCTRTSTIEGVHLQKQSDRRRLGIEVFKDIALAARCDGFVGLGSSNVTCVVYHMKAWTKQNCVIIGQLATHMTNPYIYMPIDQRARYLPEDKVDLLRERAREEQEALRARAG